MGMKRLAELTIADLTTAPVWRYEGGSGEDAAVVAERRDSLSQMDDEIFLAATEFFLPDSSQHLGFCFPVDDAGIDYLQPVIVTQTAHVRFWFDGAIAPEVLSAQWNALGRQGEEIFPMRFRCRVPVDGRTVAGVISGVESPANNSRTRSNEFFAIASEEADEISHRSRRADGTAASARPRNVRRPFAGSEGLLEKRAPRRSVEMMVEFDRDGLRGDGVTGDLSHSGMFVRATQPPSVGPSLNLTVHLPGGRTLFLKGKVVRRAVVPGFARPTGFGLRLTDKPAEYDSFLSGLLDVPK
jgi:hypothetical protein